MSKHVSLTHQPKLILANGSYVRCQYINLTPFATLNV